MNDISATMGPPTLDDTAARAGQTLRNIRHLADGCDQITNDIPLPDDPSKRSAVLDSLNLICAMHRAIVVLADGAERELEELETRLMALRRPADLERSAHCGGGHDCGAPAPPTGETRPEA